MTPLFQPNEADRVGSLHACELCQKPDQEGSAPSSLLHFLHTWLRMIGAWPASGSYKKVEEHLNGANSRIGIVSALCECSSCIVHWMLP